jgi:signal transduction histidine kinase
VSHRVHVLLIDPADDDPAALGELLGRAEMSAMITRVDDGPTLTTALARGMFDVVVCRTALPEHSVRRALETVRAREPELPLIVVSEPTGERVATELAQAGACEHLPARDLAQLPELVRRAIEDAAVRRQRRRAESALAEIERQRLRMARLLDETQQLARVGGWEIELDTFGAFFTEEAARLLGAAPGAMPTFQSIRERLPPDEYERVREAFRAAVEGGAPWDLEVQLRVEAGGLRTMRAVGHAIVEHGRPVRLVGALQDLTERRALEAKLFLADRLSSMGTIAAGVAHEINNPLTFLTVNLPLVMERLTAVEEGEWVEPKTLAHELGPLLEDAIVGAQRIAAIARDLRLFSRGDEEVPVPVALDAVIDSVLRLLRNETRHVTRLEVRKGPTPPVRGTTARLAQLFTNLLVNALQALPDRPMQENLIRLTLGTDDEGWVVATVEDNGAGIPEEVRAKIFAPFFTTKPIGVGTGLGLAVCQNIVSAFGGDLRVESEVGRGSTFIVRLAAADAPAKSQGRARGRRPTQARGRVLVVDDEAAILTLAKRLLRGHEVVAVGSVDEALRAIDASATQGAADFDVILCDLMMPDRPGHELHEELVRRGSPLADRCWFMTGGAFTPRTRAFLESLGEGRLLEKPFGAESLTAVMRAALAGKAEK